MNYDSIRGFWWSGVSRLAVRPSKHLPSRHVELSTVFRASENVLVEFPFREVSLLMSAPVLHHIEAAVNVGYHKVFPASINEFKPSRFDI